MTVLSGRAASWIVAENNPQITNFSNVRKEVATAAAAERGPMATIAVVEWRVAEVRIIKMPSRDGHLDDVYFSHFTKADPNISYYEAHVCCIGASTTFVLF
jgi:hypothetical protein